LATVTAFRAFVIRAANGRGRSYTARTTSLPRSRHVHVQPARFVTRWRRSSYKIAPRDLVEAGPQPSTGASRIAPHAASRSISCG
jgi:hypothetical protein